MKIGVERGATVLKFKGSLERWLYHMSERGMLMKKTGVRAYSGNPK